MTELNRGRAAAHLTASLLGAVLILRHWQTVDWRTRRYELGGPDLLPDEAWSAFDSPAEFVLPAAGLLLLSLGAFLGARVFAGRLGRHVAAAAGWTLILLTPAHLAEGALVFAGSTGNHPGGARFWLQATAFLGYALLPPAGLVAVLGAITTVTRLWKSLSFGRTAQPSQPVEPVKVTLGCEGEFSHWGDNYVVPASRLENAGSASGPRLGICLSGGGIRSATFCVGALQSLQAHPAESGPVQDCELSRARYLTAVSGGAYAAGAYLLSLHPQDGTRGSPAGPGQRPTACTTFAPGSPEYDHLRRHSAYLADGFREWSLAILVVLRGALLSTVLLATIAMTTGRWTGHLFHQAGRTLTGSLLPEWGAVTATAFLAALALSLWLLSLVPVRIRTDNKVRDERREQWRKRLQHGAERAGMAMAAVILLGAVIPAVSVLSARILDLSETGDTTRVATDVARGGAVGTIGLLLTVAGLLHRRSTDVAKAARYVIERTSTLRARLGDLGRSMVQWLAVYLGLAGVAAVYLLIFGYWAYTTADVELSEPVVVTWGNPDWTFPYPFHTNLAVTAALTGILIAAYLLVDETAVGLHPFYRKRLASTFAVRRSGNSAATYPPAEPTWLETYGNATQAPGEPHFPQVIFCAAAHCSDADQTPPGRHVLPCTFSYDAIGGPKLGWYSPGQARDHLSRRLQGDLTVQAAMAVSGAAFASASGRFHGPANLVLALVNARLGLWLANPRVFDEYRRHWWAAGPPRIRRMSYLVREVCGWHPRSNPLLFVSDGARYDNLGLVELLRHRCDEIYCFDASSDEATFGHALATSIALAHEELGVHISLDDPNDARPQPAKADDGFTEFEGRIASRAVITGRVVYPALARGSERRSAILVVGRAGLDPETPWEVLRHAAGHPAFPHDATGDQWFDDAKFHAYAALGRHVGRAAVAAMEEQRRTAREQQPSTGRYR